MFEDATAAELAAAFDQVQTMDLHYTGPLSMLDEASLRWAGRYPQLEPAHRAFAEAWRAVRIRGRSADREQVRLTAAALADELRPLGGVRLALCPERAGWGQCNLVLDDNGLCPAPHVHVSQP